MKRLLSLIALLAACGSEAKEHPAVKICEGCTSDQACIYVQVMTNSTTTNETARCVNRSTICTDEALAETGDCSSSCQTQFCGAGGPATCSYKARPSTVPAAQTTVLCVWGS